VTEPTNAEVMRRLEEVTRTVERLASTLETAYVRKDVYDARHEALRRETDQRFKELEDDLSAIRKEAEAQKSFRRQVGGGVLVGLLLLVAQIILVITQIPGAGT
jgi:hypothetical protein